MPSRHFLTLSDLSRDEYRSIIQRAIELKAKQKSGELFEPLKNKVLGMIFEKSSTRTRVSFEVGMAQFGGHALFLSPRDTQLGRGEPIEDTARVLSRMVDIITIRTYEHEKLLRFSKHSVAPVINALTDQHHPCQLLADMQTFMEHRGEISGKTVAWIGDGNNMCHSYIEAAQLLDFKLHIASPENYQPDSQLLKQAGTAVCQFDNASDAAKNVDLIVTDVWSSMGQESEQVQREAAFKEYQVTHQIMSQAKPNALFMHCLPAHRGEEVAADVIDGTQSVVWDEAENRLHSQKALLEFLLLEN
ncbi:MAG: ornithine carbamoyltransferase [Gammaproteobacteria bacterium]|nr:ornithine carbamoyltransferase [Gammaproteobacteria bacterium]